MPLRPIIKQNPDKMPKYHSELQLLTEKPKLPATITALPEQSFAVQVPAKDLKLGFE